MRPIGDRAVSARRIRLLIGSVAVALMSAFPARVAAVDPIIGTPLPEEPPARELAEVSTEATSFDLDGDGVEELVAVVARDGARGLAAIQAWSVEADGTVTPTEPGGPPSLGQRGRAPERPGPARYRSR